MLIELVAALVTCAAQQEPPVPTPQPAAPKADQGPPSQADAGIRLEPLGDSGFLARFTTVPRVPDVTLWFGVRVGSANDPLGQSGIARVLGEVIRADMPETSETAPREVLVLEHVTLVGVTLPRAEAPAELERFARWLSGDLKLDDDTLLRARGRALLRADDELNVLPGPVLRQRARAAACRGTSLERPLAGIPEQIKALAPLDIRSRFVEAWSCPGRAFLIALGACDDDLRAAAAATLSVDGVSSISPSEPPTEPVPHDVPDVTPVSPNDRVAAPFVVLALPAPRWGDAGYLPFLVAMEIARTRAAHTFAKLRGGEIEAEFPPLFYDPTRMPPLLFLERRGRDGDDVARVEAELTSLAAGLRAGGAGIGEIRGAILALLNRVALPPFKDNEIDVMRRYPAFLHQRGGILASYVVNGWPADLPASLGKVPVVDVQKAMQATFAEDRGRFYALEPK